MNSRRRQDSEQHLQELLRIEQSMRQGGVRLIAGIDEAGRGPLAGPVVAAAVVFDPDTRILGVDDSKRLSPERRAELYERIMETALGVGIGVVGYAEIDRINILNATFSAMHEALERLPVRPHHLLIDGDRFNGADPPFTTVIGGDAFCFSVAAASIIAKVTRDRIMVACDALHPGYGFARHKGYATPEHCGALLRLGPCPIHRRSFLSKLLGNEEAAVTEDRWVSASDGGRTVSAGRTSGPGSRSAG